MKLFKCNTEPITITIIDLPRQSWSYCPPTRWQVAVAVGSIIVLTLVFAVF